MCIAGLSARQSLFLWLPGMAEKTQKTFVFRTRFIRLGRIRFIITFVVNRIFFFIFQSKELKLISCQIVTMCNQEREQPVVYDVLYFFNLSFVNSVKIRSCTSAVPAHCAFLLVPVCPFIILAIWSSQKSARLL